MTTDAVLQERENAAKRVEAQIERLLAIGTPKPGVVEALKEACVHIRAGDTTTPVDTGEKRCHCGKVPLVSRLIVRYEGKLHSDRMCQS